jgi:hypothetical protein
MLEEYDPPYKQGRPWPKNKPILPPLSKFHLLASLQLVGNAFPDIQVHIGQLIPIDRSSDELVLPSVRRKSILTKLARGNYFYLLQEVIDFKLIRQSKETADIIHRYLETQHW